MILRRLLFALVLLVVACSQEPPKSGLVLDKTYTAAWIETGSIMTCTAYGQYGCSLYVPIPYTTHHPDKWHLFLENCDQKKKNNEPKCYKGYREVPHHIFDRTDIGGYHYGESV